MSPVFLVSRMVRWMSTVLGGTLRQPSTGRAEGEWRQAPHAAGGFSDAPRSPDEVPLPIRTAFADGMSARHQGEPSPGQLEGGPSTRPLPFPSTGPHGHRERMREKLLTRGPDALADYELLEMLLFQAMPKGDTKPLAKSLINRFGSFANVLAAPQTELLAIRGLGTHSVSAIKLVEAASLRMQRAEVIGATVLNSSERLNAYLTSAMSRQKIEQFRVLFLDSRNRLLADEAQGKGTVNHTPVYPREVVKRALELHATALILVHNHPSGDPTPSRADREMTQEVKRAAAAIGIALHDHIIVGNGDTFSFRRAGDL